MSTLNLKLKLDCYYCSASNGYTRKKEDDDTVLSIKRNKALEALSTVYESIIIEDDVDRRDYRVADRFSNKDKNQKDFRGDIEGYRIKF